MCPHTTAIYVSSYYYCYVCLVSSYYCYVCLVSSYYCYICVLRCCRHGQTPLNYAMSHRHRHVVEWMQNMGASMRVGSRRVGSDPKLSWQQIGTQFTCFVVQQYKY